MRAGTARKRTGERGERQAAQFLRRMGMRILELNRRSGLGEIDIIALQGDTVVFIEVKSKRGLSFGRPEEMVTASKRRRLTKLARAYLRCRRWQGRAARFDVVAIFWCGSRPKLRHYRNAFPAEEGW